MAANPKNAITGIDTKPNSSTHCWVHGVDTSRCLRREFTAAPSYLAAASKAPGYLLAIECQQRQLLDARPRGEREVVSLKILDAKEDLQRDNLALASQSAAISRLGPAVAG